MMGITTRAFPLAVRTLPSLVENGLTMWCTDDPAAIDGIGLPPFRTPGPPMGQPLLNQNEQEHFTNFLSDFDTSGLHSNDQSSFPPLQQDPRLEGNWNIPHYVGAETSFGTRPHIDPQHLQSSGNQPHFDFQHHGSSQLGAQGFDTSFHSPHQLYANHAFQNTFINQLPTTNGIPTGYAESWQQHSTDSYLAVHGSGRPQVRYGSDNRFQANGFTASGPQIEPDMSQMQTYGWLEAQSSATNTAPNSAHNTNPSSPVVSRKRKLDESGAATLRLPHEAMSYNSQSFANPVQLQPPRRPAHRQASSSATSMSQLTPNALATQKQVVRKTDLDDVEAVYDHDDDQATSSPGPWPANKARPPRKAPKPPKPPRDRKSSSTNAKTTPSTKATSRRRSSASRSSNAIPSRLTLTAAQKKANHTNSEQRRRDLTGRAYQELFDLVPQLENMGKQSTMKKLEIVVARAKHLKDLVERLTERRDEMKREFGRRGWAWAGGGGGDGDADGEEDGLADDQHKMVDAEAGAG